MMIARDFSYCATPFAAMAHRGGGAWGPNIGKENTLHAFAQAVSLGYRYLETDLQVTSDERLVCFHDDNLKRVTGQDGQVCEMSSAELGEVRVSGEPIPFFDDVVEAFPDVRFNLDLKAEGVIRLLVKAIRAHRLQDRILVDSFSQARLSQFRAATRGQIPTAMAPWGVAWTALVPLLGRLIASPGVAVQVPVRTSWGRLGLEIVTPQTIEAIHSIGKVIHVWTIDQPAEMERLIDMGVDGIITDRPDLLKDILVRRNLWEYA